MAPATLNPTYKWSIKLSALTKAGPKLKNENALALDTPASATDGLTNMNSDWLPLKDLELYDNWNATIN